MHLTHSLFATSVLLSATSQAFELTFYLGQQCDGEETDGVSLSASGGCSVRLLINVISYSFDQKGLTPCRHRPQALGASIRKPFWFTERPLTRKDARK